MDVLRTYASYGSVSVVCISITKVGTDNFSQSNRLRQIPALPSVWRNYCNELALDILASTAQWTTSVPL